jgi:type IV pilus assembly protein PilW
MATNPLAYFRKTRPFQTGFTLVEIMVGLAIGMLATLVIMQVFSNFEAQKRATTGSADAQTNGSIALYNIGREMQMAGYPLTPSTDSPLKCTTLTFGATGLTGISPVTITDGGGGASDTITIRYGSSAMGGIPTTITSVGAPTANDVTVDSSLGCNTNDIAMITNGTTCAMTSATAVTSSVPATVTLQNMTNATAGASIACLGNWNEVTYRVNNGNLERNGVPSVVGIVNLQAQYGVSSSATSNQVTQWVDATGGTWAAPTVADRNRIKAIRIAIVARNAKSEPGTVTAACSSTTTASPTGLCTWEGSASSPAPTIDLSSYSNWQNYHYRVFETIIPLRNVIWSKDNL